MITAGHSPAKGEPFAGEPPVLDGEVEAEELEAVEPAAVELEAVEPELDGDEPWVLMRRLQNSRVWETRKTLAKWRRVPIAKQSPDTVRRKARSA